MINEDEFFDAVDASLDKLESEADTQFERTREITKNIVRHTPTANTPGSVLTLPSTHRFTQEVGERLPVLSSVIVKLCVGVVCGGVFSTSLGGSSGSKLGRIGMRCLIQI